MTASLLASHLRFGIAGCDRSGVRPWCSCPVLLGAGELEPVKRGGYGGAIGYLSYTGDLDTCIHIRTVVLKDGRAHVQAGGGTVADAQPAYEFAESEAKARGVLRAVELAMEQPDWP